MSNMLRQLSSMQITLAIIWVGAATAACARPAPVRPGPTTAATTVQSACADPGGAAIDLRAYVVEVVTSGDSGRAELRQKLGLPALREPSEVAFETDTAICKMVVRALAAAQQDTAGGGKAAYVLRVGGAGYVAWNHEQAGEFFSYYVFDRNMKMLSAFMN